MAGFWRWLERIPARARAIVSAIRLVLDPNRLSDVFVIDRALTDEVVRRRILNAVQADPGASRALDLRWRLAPIALDRLRTFQEGSVGRSYAEFMNARGLQPSAIPSLPDEDYVMAHLYETHDLWHLVTGFDTDVAGELGMQAFYSAQLDGALPRVLIVGGLINALIRARQDWGRRLDAVARGWRLGRESRPLFGQRWDELWDHPLDEVRAQLHLDVVAGETRIR
jgi:ubiquinone biosynthesis protein Coq4